ncbi:hypothetical protein DFH28DRAFT_1014389, partial [Melampsora americana]
MYIRFILPPEYCLRCIFFVLFAMFPYSCDEAFSFDSIDSFRLVFNNPLMLFVILALLALHVMDLMAIKFSVTPLHLGEIVPV